MYDNFYDLAFNHKPAVWVGSQISEITNFENYCEFVNAKIIPIFDNDPVTIDLKFKKIFLEFDNKEKYEKDCANFVIDNLMSGKLYISTVQIGKNDHNKNPFIYIEYYR